MAFCNQFERDIHFAKHGHDFGAADASEYEQMADDFMYGPLGPDTHECTRPLGPTGVQDELRFDFGTHFEAVACIVPAFIRTFYTVRIMIIARHGGQLGYFAYECGRIAGVNL